MRQDGWLLGTGCTTTHQNEPLLPYFQCTRPPFPSLCTGSAPFGDKTSFPAPRSPSSPLSSRAEQHPACPKSPAYCHSPFSPALFLLTRFAFFFFNPSKVTKLSPQGHLELGSSTGFTRQEPGSGWAMASPVSINLLAHSSLSQTHRKNDISISFERRCRETGKSTGPIDFHYVCSLPPGINTTAKSIGITSYQLSNLFCSLYILQHFLQLLHRRLQHLRTPRAAASSLVAPPVTSFRSCRSKAQLCAGGAERSPRAKHLGCVRAALAVAG